MTTRRDSAQLSRRDFLGLGVAAGPGLMLPSCGVVPSGPGNNSWQRSAGTPLRSAVPLPEPFRVPLPVPPVLQPVRRDAATDYYEITQQVGQTEAGPHPNPTAIPPTWSRRSGAGTAVPVATAAPSPRGPGSTSTRYLEHEDMMMMANFEVA